MKNDTATYARAARDALLAKKGEEVIILDVRGLSNVTDYYIIGTGNNGPHIRALYDEVDRTIREKGLRVYRKAGTPDSEWIVADCVDLVVHIFSPATRKYYELERLWRDAKVVE